VRPPPRHQISRSDMRTCALPADVRLIHVNGGSRWFGVGQPRFGHRFAGTSDDLRRPELEHSNTGINYRRPATTTSVSRATMSRKTCGRASRLLYRSTVRIRSSSMPVLASMGRRILDFIRR